MWKDKNPCIPLEQTIPLTRSSTKTTDFTLMFPQTDALLRMYILPFVQTAGMKALPSVSSPKDSPPRYGSRTTDRSGWPSRLL